MLAVVSVEKEKLVTQMLKETMPLFVDRLQQALIIRENRWNDDQKRRWFAIAGVVCLALVGIGYGLHMLQSWGATSGMAWCLWHQLAAANGHNYCDMTVLQHLQK